MMQPDSTTPKIATEEASHAASRDVIPLSDDSCPAVRADIPRETLPPGVEGFAPRRVEGVVVPHAITAGRWED